MAGGRWQADLDLVAARDTLHQARRMLGGGPQGVLGGRWELEVEVEVVVEVVVAVVVEVEVVPWAEEAAEARRPWRAAPRPWGSAHHPWGAAPRLPPAPGLASGTRRHP